METKVSSVRNISFNGMKLMFHADGTTVSKYETFSFIS